MVLNIRMSCIRSVFISKAAPAAFMLCCVFFKLTAQPNPHYRLKGSDYVTAKNYYLLNLLMVDAPAQNLLEHDPVLSGLSASKINALKTSLQCKDVNCFTSQLKFSAEEIKQVGERLTALYQPNNALGSLVTRDLVPSGCYVLNKNLSPVQQLVKAWEQDAEGINYVIEVYTDGKKPNYPDIDSISFKVNAKSYPDVLIDCATAALATGNNSRLFFAPVMNYALQALQINGRYDAANFEPLTAGLNKSALAKIKQTVWKKFPYTVILILGSGPNDLNTSISAIGMLRCRMGAANYFKGLAPFIMTSGGMAHPYKTKYCEAVEMKKFLVNELHVPASAVIAEPQARHTTTNVRNGERLMYRYLIPYNKPFLTTTSKSHSDYVENQMADRCLKELKYVPYKVGPRVSETTLALYPNTNALQINPLEPLDPR